MKLDELDKDDIIIGTKNNFEKNECCDIGTRKRLWIRNCPQCNMVVFHTHKESCRNSYIKNKTCQSCARRNITNITRKKMSIISKNRRSYNSIKSYRSNLSELERLNFSLSISKENNPNWRGGKCFPHCPVCDKIMSRKAKMCIKCSMKDEECRKNKRESAVKRILKNGITISYNKNACRYFDKLNEEKGIRIQHALNGGEFKFRGFFADGYDKTTNTWYEWDERHHYYKNGQLKDQDVQRQKEIIKYLNCKFIRVREEDINQSF